MGKSCNKSDTKVEAHLKDARVNLENSSFHKKISKKKKKEFEAASAVMKTTKRKDHDSCHGSLEEEVKTNVNVKKQKKDVLKRHQLKARRMCDLPPELVGEKILTRIPLTSLGAVRSTCKLWKALSRDWILGKAAARQHFLGFMTMDSKVCAARFDDLRKDHVDLSVKQVALLDQVEISTVFHCDGLLLCVAKDLRLMVWNPYLGQTRWIEPRKEFHKRDVYALGYDKHNRNHKILRHWKNCMATGDVYGYEIYDFISNSWRVLDVTIDVTLDVSHDVFHDVSHDVILDVIPHWDVTPDWDIESYQRGASLKGNTFFVAHEKGVEDEESYEDFLLCFDFTAERFGPHLPLPFHTRFRETVTLSCVGEEQLAVLHQMWVEILEIWVTTKIEPNSVSWSRFLKVDMNPLTGYQFLVEYGSFFIDEEQKVAVVFDTDTYDTTPNHTAFIIGDDKYFKAVSLEVAPNIFVEDKPCRKTASGYIPYITSPPLVCSSSYRPSLVQINQPR